MLFRQLFDSESSTYTYILASDFGQEGIIIDPVLNQYPLYAKLLAELELKLVLAIDTHVHADHISALNKLQQSLHCKAAMGEKSPAEWVSVRLKDGEWLQLPGIKLQAIYTPGHTDDSYSFYTGERVFTGDTLLIRGTGRTDFQNGSPYQEYDSLFNRLLKLPEDTFVYPAHDYKGMTVSTIGEEKRYNPRLQVSSVDQYVEIMNNLNLARPKLMDLAVPANLRGDVE